MPNNVGEPTVDELYQRVATTASPKMDHLSSIAISIANSGLGVITRTDGSKTKKY